MAAGEMSSRRFEGRVAIVTGGAGGQGWAEVQRFQAEGASVVATDIAPPADLPDDDHLLFVAHDVASPADWAAVVDAAIGRWGRIDVLVNNAGIYWQRSIADESADGMRRMLDVDLVGPFLGVQAVSPVMQEQRSGAIVNIASTAGCSGFPGHAAYGAAKWGLRGLTRTASVELGPFGIRVNCMLPGAVDTAMRPSPGANGSTAATTEADGSGTDPSRVASPAEMASIVAFLASDDAAAITGAELVADGGYLVGLGHAPLVSARSE